MKDEKQWKALASLANSPEGSTLREMLRQDLAQVHEDLEVCPDVLAMGRLQGRAGFISNLLDDIGKANEVVRAKF